MENQTSQTSKNYSMPNQINDAANSIASLSKILTEVPNMLVSLRRELRGEGLYQDEKNGTNHWIQVTKPVFVVIDFKTRKPVKENITMPWGEEKECYIPNDEAIDELISMLKFIGINNITPLANISEDNYLDDLKEFECKLSAVLMLKQKRWGLDKELLPMYMAKIKTIVQDVRSMCIDGHTIKAIQTTVQRVEQLFEGNRESKILKSSPY